MSAFFSLYSCFLVFSQRASVFHGFRVESSVVFSLTFRSPRLRPCLLCVHNEPIIASPTAQIEYVYEYGVQVDRNVTLGAVSKVSKVPSASPPCPMLLDPRNLVPSSTQRATLVPSSIQRATLVPSSTQRDPLESRNLSHRAPATNVPSSSPSSLSVLAFPSSPNVFLCP